MNKLISGLSTFVIVLCSAFVPARAIEVAEQCNNKADYPNIKLSPDRQHIGIKFKQEGEDIVAVFNCDSLKLTGLIGFNVNAQVGDYEWVNNERLVVTKEYLNPDYDKPVYKGQIYSVKYNGQNSRYIFGYGKLRQLSGNASSREGLNEWGFVTDILPDDPKHILVYSHPWKAYKTAPKFDDVVLATKDYTTGAYRGLRADTGADFPRLFKVNILTGKRKIVASEPDIDVSNYRN